MSATVNVGIRRIVLAALVVVPAHRAFAAEPARVPVRIVDGRLVVACQIDAKKRIAANLFIDYDAPVGLLLHNRAAAGIEAENEDGTPNPITVHLPDLNVAVAQREVGDEAEYERFTKWFSKELGENAVVGTLGSHALADYHATFDLAHGFLELEPAHALTGTPPEDAPGSATLPITLVNDLVWCPVRWSAGSGAAAIATSKYESRVEKALAVQLGHPAGDVGAVQLGPIDVASFVALRPEKVRQVHPDGVFGTLGLDFLLHFRVEIDRVNRFARFTQTAPAQFPTADLEFYRARAAGDAAALAAWLDAHPAERLAPEAAALLLEMRLDAHASPEDVTRALECVQATRPADLKATGALELLKKMQQAGESQWALAAGRLGLEHGREDRYPDAVHRLHAKLGSILLEQGQRREAWTHLLSAAFGLPEDGPLNLDLARCYEQEGRFSRAYSRYLQALLSPESGTAAIEGMERVQPKLDDAEAFNVESIEKRIEGKVEGFGAATRFHPPEDAPPSRAVLIEYFTNAHFEFEIGVDLARDGLRDHFGEHAVLLTWHGPEPQLDSLVNPLSMHAWQWLAKGTFAHRADGLMDLPAGARSRFKQEVYDKAREIVEARLAIPSPYALAIRCTSDATGIRGEVEARGPDDPELMLQILLVERGVLCPGLSKVVIHRNVVRAALTQDLDGVAFHPEGGAMKVAFDSKFADVVAANDAFLDAQEKAGKGSVSRFPVRIDPAQARVVAVLRRMIRGTGGEVVQAAQIDPAPPAAEGPP